MAILIRVVVTPVEGQASGSDMLPKWRLLVWVVPQATVSTMVGMMMRKLMEIGLKVLADTLQGRRWRRSAVNASSLVQSESPAISAMHLAAIAQPAQSQTQLTEVVKTASQSLMMQTQALPSARIARWRTQLAR